MASNKSTTDLKQSQANDKKKKPPQGGNQARGSKNNGIGVPPDQIKLWSRSSSPDSQGNEKRVSRWDTDALLQPCPKS